MNQSNWKNPDLMVGLSLVSLKREDFYCYRDWFCHCCWGASAAVVVRLHRQGCSFTSRLVWEASRYCQAILTMEGLLTWWRSRSQLATSLIGLFFIPFLFLLSCCHLSSFSLLLLPLKVLTSAPHLVLSPPLFHF